MVIDRNNSITIQLLNLTSSLNQITCVAILALFQLGFPKRQVKFMIKVIFCKVLAGQWPALFFFPSSFKSSPSCMSWSMDMVAALNNPN